MGVGGTGCRNRGRSAHVNKVRYTVCMKTAGSFPNVTKRLNEIYRDEESSLDPVMAAIQSASIVRDDSERQQELLAMFNEAAAEITEEDLADRESLLSGFAGRSEEPEPLARVTNEPSPRRRDAPARNR